MSDLLTQHDYDRLVSAHDKRERRLAKWLATHAPDAPARHAEDLAQLERGYVRAFIKERDPVTCRVIRAYWTDDFVYAGPPTTFPEPVDDSPPFGA
jgi:hypothetical protein